MNHTIYCYLLMASTAMGNNLTLNECYLLNNFLRQQKH